MELAAPVPLTADDASKRNKRIGGAALLAVAGLCGYLATLFGFFPGLLACIFTISGISLLGTSFSYSGRGPCPSCGKELRDLLRDQEAAACNSCGSIALVRDAHLLATPPDYVAKHGVYPVIVEIGTQPDFHGLCVTCGKPATATLPRELTKTVAGVPGVGRLIKKWKIAIALCAEHSKPDSLGNPPGVTSYEAALSISSYRTWRAASGRG